MMWSLCSFSTTEAGFSIHSGRWREWKVNGKIPSNMLIYCRNAKDTETGRWRGCRKQQALWEILLVWDWCCVLFICRLLKSLTDSKLMCMTLADLHHRDPGDAAGPWTSEAAELWHAHRGAVPSQHGDARRAGGWWGLWGDPGGHPRGVLQVWQRPLHRDPPTRRWRRGPRLWKGKHCVCTSIHLIFSPEQFYYTLMSFSFTNSAQEFLFGLA